MNSDKPAYFDVIVVGAGLSGIGAAWHLQHDSPKRTFTILESRAAIGGTWDLFKYPGIRSDSDMYTLGFPFFPWKDPKAIADGPAILEYIKETASTFGIDKKIRFHHKVINAEWSSKDSIWTVTIAAHEDVKDTVIQCNFLFMCSGYYNYEQGYSPKFPESESFQGTIIHPQKWDTDLQYDNKKIVVIGSGATAVTLVPELSKKAAEVTMLQRSPTYIMNLPSEDIIANFFKKILPAGMAHNLTRWKNVLLSLGIYKACRKWPETMKGFFMKNVRKELGEGFDMKHFDPKYDPWDQRLCLVPDADLFKAIRGGKANIVTDTIKRFTPKGILLNSGTELEADIIVTATGLNLQLMGGMSIRRDGKPVDFGGMHVYKGVMLSDLPNFAFAVGYTNASWTLKCDLNCTFVARLLNHMDKHGFKYVTPRYDSSAFTSEPLLDFDAGYVKRAESMLPKQGSGSPWKVYQNYIKDLFTLKYSSVKDKYLEYHR